MKFGLSGIKNYNLQAILEFCVCLVKCGNTDKANLILSQILKSPISRTQQKVLVRLICSRIGNLKVLGDLDILLARCIVGLPSRIEIDEDNMADHCDPKGPLYALKEEMNQPLAKLTAELCGRIGTSVRKALPRSQELLSWCLEQHFDQKYLSDSGMLEKIACDIQRQEQDLKTILHGQVNTSKMREDSQRQVLNDIQEKFAKWMQIVETWCEQTV
jgi:hypothetical protein